MRILITGVNGFIGKSLFCNLSKEQEVYGIFNSGVALSERCFQVDLTNKSAVDELFQNKLNLNIDILIHCASRMAFSDNIFDTSLIADNARITKNIAVAAKKNGIKHIIYFSSSSVYPNIDGIFNETSKIDPSPNSDCFYGLSKYNGEIIFNCLFKDSDIYLTHLRVAMIYGMGMHKTRLISVFVKELLETNTITLFGNGKRLFNIISTQKLNEYINFFVHYPINDIINVAEETITAEDIAKRIISENGDVNSKIIFLEKGDRSRFILDTTKLQNHLSKTDLC